jgi:hypothetical protein
MVVRRSGIMLGVAALMVAVGSITVSAFADARLIPPKPNRVRVFPAPNVSATLNPATTHFLASRGIHYVIPRVPSGFPPVKAAQAIRVAASHFPLGPAPRVRGLAFIALRETSMPPLRYGMIVWAISFVPPGRNASGYFIAFVEVMHPRSLGALASGRT